MRIVRYLSPNGPAYASYVSRNRLCEVRGDLFGEYHITDQEVAPERLLAPIDPVYVACIGLNYRQHAIETNCPEPAHPVLFVKNPASIQHPGAAIELPAKLPSGFVDYECELAVVIGRRCKNVSRAEALQYVLGYTCANDITARDWQFNGGGGQWCQGKSFDTFCPLGPVLVTTDEIPNPNALRIRTILNGETVQDSNTADMIFDVPRLIEFLSAGKTLLPGTVILTGTPQGVGFARKPPLSLKSGDVVTVDIENIGTLTNTIAAEATPPPVAALA